MTAWKYRHACFPIAQKTVERREEAHEKSPARQPPAGHAQPWRSSSAQSGTALVLLLSSVQGILCRASARRSSSPPASTATLSWAPSRPTPWRWPCPSSAALPYTASFIDDVKSGFIKEYLPRTTVPRYIAGKAVGCAVSGGLALALGIFIAYGFAALHVPAHGGLPGCRRGTVPNYFGNLMETALMFFASGAFWSLVRA